MKNGFSVLIVALGIAGLLGFAAIPSSADEAIPLPSDINIIPPSADLPKELAAFSGRWEGVWTYYTPFVLIVEKINEQSATVVYAVPADVRARTKGLFARLNAQVVRDKKPRLECTSVAGARLMFILNNGSLDAIYFGKGGSPLRATANRTDGNTTESAKKK